MKAPLFLTALFSFLAAASAVEYSEEKIGDVKVTVCRVNVRREHLQLFLRDDSQQLIGRFDKLAAMQAAHGHTLVFAMNAGMFEPSYAPVGLFVADGKTLAPLNTASGTGNFYLEPNGVFLLTQGGAKVIETPEYPALREPILLATQSGPLLVRHGKLHPAFIADSTSRLFRNGVGVPNPETALFAITEGPVNFHEFATFFRDTLHCPDALFLDGTVSSLYASKLHRSDFHIQLGPIIGATE
jgi:uncharacterized protein YigE (DUF2233 family)